MCRVTPSMNNLIFKIKLTGLVSYGARATTYMSPKLFVTFLFDCFIRHLELKQTLLVYWIC